MRLGSVIALYVFLPPKERNSGTRIVCRSKGALPTFPPTIVLDGLVPFARACTDEQILKDEWTSGGKRKPRERGKARRNKLSANAVVCSGAV